MADWFWCTPCRTAYMLLTKPVDNKCPAYRDTKGEVVFEEQMKQGFGGGTHFNIDLATRRPAKGRRRAV